MPSVVTLPGVAGIIQPIVDPPLVRVSFSCSMSAASSATARFFVVHPEDLSFDSLQISLTGQRDLAGFPSPWFATAQLLQLIENQFVQVSGAFDIEKDETQRLATMIQMENEGVVTELQAGVIRRPWPLFVEIKVLNLLIAVPLPGTVDPRVQVTVNLLAGAVAVG